MFNEARHIQEAIRKFQAIIPVMVNDMGQIGLNHFTQSFRNQGFTDETLEPWQPRKRNRDPGRGILIGKGTANMRKLRKARKDRLSTMIMSNTVTNAYAKVHNDGLRAGRGRGFIMPKRQFIGDSKRMNRKIKEKLMYRIRQVFPR